MDLKSLVKDFFNENEFGRISNHLSIVRNDGIVIYSNSDNKFMESSLGALSSGLWQAATSMMSYIGENDDDIFRLSFDTSSSGIFILPTELNNSRCYTVSIYQDALNPAKLKQQLKNLVFLLEMYIRDESISVSNESSTKENRSKRDGYLFDEITDDEIDKLFSFGRV